MKNSVINFLMAFLLMPFLTFGQITMSTTTTSITADPCGKTYPISITSNTSWRITAPNWVTVTPDFGTGNKDVNVDIKPNSSGLTRNGDIIITAAGINKKIPVTQVPIVFTVSPPASLSTVPVNGGIYSITNITSNCAITWTAPDKPWIKVDWLGTGNTFTASITVEPNPTADSRTGSFTVTSGGIDKKVTITQVAAVLTVTATPVPIPNPIPAIGKTYTLAVKSNIAWSITVPPADSWLTVTPPSGANDKTISLTVALNPKEVSRTGSFTISGGEITRTVTVTQEAANLTVVTPMPNPVPASSKTYDLVVSSNLDWVATVPPEYTTWLSVVKVAGIARATITANPTEAPRSGNFTVKAGDITRTVSVTQEGVSLNVDATAIPNPVKGSGGSYTIVVKSNVNWTASDVPTWITLTPALGVAGTANVIVKIAANTSVARSNIFKITGNNISRTVSVSQAAAPTLTLSPALTPFSADGSYQYVDVTSNHAWTVNNANTWFTVTLEPNTTGTGNGKLKVTAIANSAINNVGTPRLGEFTVNGDNITKLIKVSQDAPSLSLSAIPTTLTTASADGTNPSITVNANVAWSVTSSVNWITISPVIGSFSINVLPNTGVERNGTITVIGGGITRSISVKQVAPNLTAASSEVSFSPGASTSDLIVKSNIKWTVSNDNPWFTVAAVSGTGDGVAKVTVLQNTGAERSGTFTINGGGITRTINVKQEKPTLTVSSTNLFICGTSGTINVTANISWVVNNTNTWFSVTPNRGTKDSPLTVTAPANLGSPRKGTFTVSDGAGLTHTITVEQAGLMLSASAIPFAPAGSTFDVKVTCNSNWSVSEKDAWLTLPSMSGTGDGTFTVKAEPNTGIARKGKLTITCCGISKTIDVTQEAQSLSVPITPINAPVAGLTKEVIVTSNISWTVSKENERDTWFSFSPNADNGNGKITVQVEANTGIARSGNFIVSGGSGRVFKYTIKITQAARVLAFVVNNTNIADQAKEVKGQQQEVVESSIFSTVAKPVAMPINFTSSLKTSVSPNPASAQVHLQIMAETEGDYELTVFNTFGQLVLKENYDLSKGENREQFDVSALTKGLYMVRVKHNGLVSTQKLMVK